MMHLIEMTIHKTPKLAWLSGQALKIAEYIAGYDETDVLARNVLTRGVYD